MKKPVMSAQPTQTEALFAIAMALEHVADAIEAHTKLEYPPFEPADKPNEQSASD